MRSRYVGALSYTYSHWSKGLPCIEMTFSNRALAPAPSAKPLVAESPATKVHGSDHVFASWLYSHLSTLLPLLTYRLVVPPAPYVVSDGISAAAWIPPPGAYAMQPVLSMLYAIPVNSTTITALLTPHGFAPSLFTANRRWMLR